MDVREKMIDIVEDYADFLDWDRKDAMVDSIMEFLATENNVGRKWISVKDRLPDLELAEVKTDDNDVFPCLAARKHPRAKNGKYTTKVWYDGYGFIDFVSNDVTDEVTHWMPLPQPPKGE